MWFGRFVEGIGKVGEILGFGDIFGRGVGDWGDGVCSFFVGCRRDGTWRVGSFWFGCGVLDGVGFFGLWLFWEIFYIRGF